MHHVGDVDGHTRHTNAPLVVGKTMMRFLDALFKGVSNWNVDTLPNGNLD